MCYRLLLRWVIYKESFGEFYRGHSASALDILHTFWGVAFFIFLQRGSLFCPQVNMD